MVKINIESVRNGYYVIADNDEEDSETNSFVFEEKEREVDVGYNIPKERIQTFKDLVEFLENQFGLDCVNDGDYFFEGKILKKEKYK